MPNPCAACDVRVRAVCSALSNEELRELSSVSRSRKLDTGEAAFMEGDAVPGYLIIQSGSLKLYKLLPDGRRQIVGFAFSGELVGLPFERTEAFTAEALQATEVCQLGRDMLEEMSSASPQLARRLIASASAEIAAAQEQMMLLGRKTAEERLASFILWLSHKAELRGEDHVTVALPMSRNDIGDYLGLTVETVSRTFTKLKADRVIALPTRGSVEITRRAALEEIAAGE